MRMTRKYPTSPRSLTTVPASDTSLEDTMDSSVLKNTEELTQDLGISEEVTKIEMEKKVEKIVVEKPKLEIEVKKPNPELTIAPTLENPPPNLPTVTQPRRNIPRFTR